MNEPAGLSVDTEGQVLVAQQHTVGDRSVTDQCSQFL